MKFLFVMDPLDGIDISMDTSFVFLAEAQSRGHENWFCQVDQLLYDDGLAAHAAPVTVKPVQGEHFELGQWSDQHAGNFDAIFMRKDPPFDSDFFFATQLLSLADPARTFVFNNPAGLREISEKLSILRFPDLVAETIVTADPQRVLAFMQRLGEDVVVKPLDGCGGQGIFRLSAGDLNINAILELSTDNGCRQIMAQRYLPESREGDTRLVYLEGRAAGAMRRVPRADDLRGNLHVGGSVVAADIGEREHEICRAIEPLLYRLSYLGVRAGWGQRAGRARRSPQLVYAAHGDKRDQPHWPAGDQATGWCRPGRRGHRPGRAPLPLGPLSRD